MISHANLLFTPKLRNSINKIGFYVSYDFAFIINSLIILIIYYG